MKINNEKGKYTLHFIFHINVLHIKSSRIPVMEINVNITYQVLGYNRTHKTYIRISKEEYIEVHILMISLKKCVSNR